MKRPTLPTSRCPPDCAASSPVAGGTWVAGVAASLPVLSDLSLGPRGSSSQFSPSDQAGDPTRPWLRNQGPRSHCDLKAVAPPCASGNLSEYAQRPPHRAVVGRHGAQGEEDDWHPEGTRNTGPTAPRPRLLGTTFVGTCLFTGAPEQVALIAGAQPLRDSPGSWGLLSATSGSPGAPPMPSSVHSGRQSSAHIVLSQTQSGR